MRRAAVAALLAAGCVAETGPPPTVESGIARGTNVVLVTLDTTRADRLGAYGDPDARTPVLDRLASEGVRFDNAISPAPLTLPSHVSLFTGLEPPAHGVRANGLYRLDDERDTLAEAMRSQGYETAAFVSAFVLDARYGLAQGFDVFDDRVRPLADQAFGGLDSQRDAREVTDAAIDWLERQTSGRPYFVWVHYYDPHTPYEPPDGFPQSYEGELAYVDSELGRLLSVTSDAGLVVVAGDHGESLGEHSEPTHSRFIYEPTQRVPLVFWAPGLLPPRVVSHVVGLIDVAPSLLHLVGAESPSAGDGVNLFSGTVVADRAIYMETLATYLDNGWAPLFGLRSRTEKLILAPTPELYDLERDPEETRNLYTATSPHSLETELEARLAEMPDFIEVAAATRQLESDELERLQALGYLGGAGPASNGEELSDPKEMMSLLELLGQAESARRAGRLDEALEKAERAFAGAPRDLQVLQELGILYAQSGRLGDAERVFTAYLERKPNVNVSILLANVLRELGRPIEGRSIVERAREQDPGHGGVLITLGDFEAADGRLQVALSLYERAKEVDPYRASATANRRIMELRSR